jgi:glycosyltransferase involved in cell wall biosynthesis
MKNLKKYNLGLIFTQNVSLAKWSEVGMLEREVKPYNLLAKHFNRIYFFTYGGKTDLEYQKYLADNITIIPNRFRLRDKYYKYLLPFLNWKKIRKCHVIKTNQIKGSEAAIMAKKYISRHARLLARSGYTWSLFAQRQGVGEAGVKPVKELESRLYRLADAAAVTSQADKEYIMSEYATQESKISIIPNYINTESFKPDNSIQKYDNRIIFVGRLNKQKNLKVLIQALAGSQIELDIIGSGEEKESLESEAERNNVTLNFLGNIPNNELPEKLAQYPIFVLPSLYEGMPKTLLEAMSCGLACVGTDVPGINEVIRHEENGLLALSDAKDLQKQILRLANDQDLRNRLGQNARQFILNNYSLDTQIEKEIQIYEKLLEKN